MRHFFPFCISIMFFLAACGDTTTPSSPSDSPGQDSSKVSAEYICPCGHCGYEGGSEPGTCPKCGMELELAKK